jgi:hypothetical protein
MANPTTNYGFVLPTATDLVTDLPADFDVALQGVDTRLKALQPGTTLGDLAYSSATANTNTRLGIGSSGQVLQVSGGVPAWGAAPASSSSWSLLNASGTALTGATTITISSISGKDKLLILISGGSSANGSSDLAIRFNADSTNANYAWNGTRFTNGSAFSQTAVSTTNGGGDPYFKFAVFSDNAASVTHGYLLMDGANSSGLKVINAAFSATAGGGTNQRQEVVGGYYAGTSTISSISIISSSGNWDAGTVFIYGSA